MAGGGGMKPQTPASPDFTQAALQTAMMGREGMREQTWANRPNVNTPWGSTSWSVTPGSGNPYGMQQQGGAGAGGGTPGVDLPGILTNEGTPAGGAGAGGSLNDLLTADKMQPPGASGPGEPYTGTPGSVPGGATGQPAPDPGGGYGFTPETWTMNVNLTPEQQAIFDTQQEIQGQRGDLAQTLLGSASDVLGQQADWSSLPAVGNGMDARNRAEEALYSRATSRLDPMWNQREDQTRTRLYNMGLREGDAAFDQEMGNLGRSRTDAYDAAMNQAIGAGGGEMTRQFGQEMQGRQQSISEMLGQRSGTLNELQALLSGQQVGMPQSPGFMGAGAAQAPNLLGAAQAQYGAGLDQFNAQQAQMQGLLGGGMALAPYMFSDARLKDEIRYLEAEALPGVHYASWRWKTGGHGFGVIAQDVQKVRPDLVKRGPGGFLMVNMEAIGGES